MGSRECLALLFSTVPIPGTRRIVMNSRAPAGLSQQQQWCLAQLGAFIALPVVCDALVLSSWRGIAGADWWARLVVAAGAMFVCATCFAMTFVYARARRLARQPKPPVGHLTRSIAPGLGVAMDIITALSWYILALPLTGPTLFHALSGTFALSSSLLDVCIIFWVSGLAASEIADAILALWMDSSPANQRRLISTAILWLSSVTAYVVVRRAF